MAGLTERDGWAGGVKSMAAATLEGPWEDVPAGGGGLGEVALPLRFFKVECCRRGQTVTCKMGMPCA